MVKVLQRRRRRHPGARAGNGPPVPAVTGFESKMPEGILNSGGNTDTLFALSQWLRAFFVFRGTLPLAVLFEPTLAQTYFSYKRSYSP